MTSSDLFDLEDDYGPEGFHPATKSAGIDEPTEKFPCSECSGTGFYQGHRVHQEKQHCFACRGKGYFLTSARDRQAKAAKRAAKKEADKFAVIDAFNEEHPGMIDFLKGASSWSSYAADMLGNLSSGKALTSGQLAGINSMRNKQALRDEARATERKASTVAGVDLTPIRVMFEAAVVNGYKAPKYRAEGLVITRAAMTGKNPGALYVKDENDTYLGKIIGTEYQPTRDGKASGATLLAIAADPLAAAIAYGNRTGRCACCGRKLSNDESITRGIGPICAERWGLTEVKSNPTKEEVKEELADLEEKVLGTRREKTPEQKAKQAARAKARRLARQ